MIRKFYAETNAGGEIVFVDNSNKCYWYSAADYEHSGEMKEFNYDNVSTDDYSAVDECKTAQEVLELLAKPNSISGLIIDKVVDFDPGDFEVLREF